MKVGITGTASGLSESQFLKLREVLPEFDIDEFHGGDCIGVDAEVVMLVRELHPSAKLVGHPPYNPRKRAFLEYDEIRQPAPYLERNHHIVDDVDVLIACPASQEILRSGTWATVRYARKLIVPVLVIYRDGTYGE